MKITGEIFIGNSKSARPAKFPAQSPLDNTPLQPLFSEANTEDVKAACALANDAALPFSTMPLEARAGFLEAIADEIMALGDRLIERANQETGLPVARLQGERGRTVGQLKLFASEVRDGAWLGIRIDPAMPDRQPAPRASHAAMQIPLGPVAVFGASNFPLAFSVAGGDTASALAAGCPVVVKGHPAHPGTSELVARAILAAAEKTGMPDGVFSLLQGPSHELGTALVGDPNIAAVGFTGSRAGGLALIKVAAERDEPIPVYAEMSAINPVILLPGALEADPAGLAKAFAASLQMGAGQFCTNPGLVLAAKSSALDTFRQAAAKEIEDAAAQTMLTAGIHAFYCKGVGALDERADTQKLASGAAQDGANAAVPALFETSATSFTGNDARAHEVFGPSSVLVTHDEPASFAATLEKLEGQLTASLHFTDSDLPLARSLVPVLQRKVGRIIANGWPTGVEVCHAMVHGGPFPATSDARTTSVGTLAINRFLRPVCYQNFPDSLLPDTLKPAARTGKLRRVDGAWVTS